LIWHKDPLASNHDALQARRASFIGEETMPKKEALRRISRLLAATDLSARSDRAVGVAGSLGAFVVTMLLGSERG
jgi:hypothetical protein